MKTALLISGVILLWYCVKEWRNSQPNWTRAINMAIFWPFSLLFTTSTKKKTEE